MSIDTTVRNGDAHTRADLARLAFGVRGMTCASCVSHVESALTSVEGVTEASGVRQQQTHAPQRTISQFDHLVGAGP